MIVFSAVQISRDSEGIQFPDGFTQLWLVPIQEDAGHVTLGLANFEGQPLDYDLQLTQDNQTLQAWNGIHLADREQWEIVVEVPPLSSGSISAVVYLSDNPNDIYREVSLHYWPRN